MVEGVVEQSAPARFAPWVCFRHSWFACLMLSALMLPVFFLAGRSASAQPAVNERIEFEISEQPLETALDAFVSISRLQVLYETWMTDGLRSAEVKGLFTREAALRQLLSGTGLDFIYTEQQAFTLVFARQTTTRPISDFDTFLGLVQARVVAALCRYLETRPGAFRLALQLRIRPDGRVLRPVLLGSTGEDRRDAAIGRVLTNLIVDMGPPPNMPQPITLVLLPGAPNGTDACPSEPRQ